MTRKAVRSIISLIAFLGFTSSTAVAEQESSPFESLKTNAEAIVAAEILSTDYRATPADGPMKAVAKVLKVLKGPLAGGKKFSFSETAWVGPTYQAGEFRILFLEKAKPITDSPTSPWRVLSHLYAKSDFFIEKESIPSLSLPSLQLFLKKIKVPNKARKHVFNKETSQQR